MVNGIFKRVLSGQLEIEQGFITEFPLRIQGLTVMRRSSERDKVLDMSDQEGFRALGKDPSHLVKDIFENQMSPQAQRMRADIARVSRRPYNILITGET